MNPITMQLVADEYIRMALKEDINSEDVFDERGLPELTGKGARVQLLGQGRRYYRRFTGV